MQDRALLPCQSYWIQFSVQMWQEEDQEEEEEEEKEKEKEEEEEEEEVWLSEPTSPQYPNLCLTSLTRFAC